MNPALRQQLIEGEKLGRRYALAIPQTAQSGISGTQLGHHAGSSLDFQEHRDYQPGDDLRRIDWNGFARSDKLVVKVFREEVAPHLDLLLDLSRSMDLPDTRKAESLGRLAAALAIAAENSGCTHSVWTAHQGFHRLFNDRLRPSTWSGMEFDRADSIGKDFELLPPTLRRQGIRILISDLLFPGDPFPLLRRLTDGAASVWLIQLLARADVEPPDPGSLRLTDSETGEELDMFIDAMVRKNYGQSLEQHQRLWQQACRQTRARMLTVVAEDLLASETLTPLTPLEEAGLLQAS